MIERPTYSVLKHSKYCLIVFLSFNSCCGQPDSDWGCLAFQFKRQKWDVHHFKTRSTFISGQRQDRHLRQILTGESERQKVLMVILTKNTQIVRQKRSVSQDRIFPLFNPFYLSHGQQYIFFKLPGKHRYLHGHIFALIHTWKSARVADFNCNLSRHGK